jgi:NADPH-dependent curcumin reductase CurA
MGSKHIVLMSKTASREVRMIAKRLTMKGFIVRDWLDRQGEFEKEVGTYFRGGKLKHKETVVEAIDRAVGAFIGLFEGKNLGKMVVKLA